MLNVLVLILQLLKYVGGTWDSTNIINQLLLSIIVSISLDHTKLLGNTIQQITADKCGIIKEGMHSAQTRFCNFAN